MQQEGSIHKYWWDLPKSKVHEELFRIVKFLENNQQHKESGFIDHLYAYTNYQNMGLASSVYSRNAATNSKNHPVTYNLTQSCIDTVTAKIAKNKVKPLFVTSGGDVVLQDKAKKLNKFVEGIFYQTKLYEKEVQVFRDSCIWGTAPMKIYRERNQIKCERVTINELMIDDAEAMYGEPKQMHQKKFIPRDVMISMYPGYKSELSSTAERKPTSGYSTLSDMLLVSESWHLAKNVGEDDYIEGRHVVCVENCDLIDEEYKKDYFPFVFQRWSKKPLGFEGTGICEELDSIQKEVDKLLRTIQLCMRLCSVPSYWVPFGSKTPVGHFNNTIGGLKFFTPGLKPELEAKNSVPPELLEHLKYLISIGYQKVGVSELSASSKKPPGLDSGKALREYSDIETERFMTVGQSREDWFLEVSKQMIEIAKEIELDGFDYKVKVKGKKFLETIKWKDINLDEDEYLMQVFPTSMLSDTPSGRLADIQEMMQAGMIDPQFGMKLLGIPDLEMYTNFMTAPLDDILNLVELLAEGKYQSPEPFQDLKLGLKLVQFAYLMYKNDGLPETKLENFRKWLEEADAEVNPPQPQGMLPQGIPGATPQGRGAKPPISNMIPFQSGQQAGQPMGGAEASPQMGNPATMA